MAVTLAFLLFASTAPAEVVERILAVVGGRPVTLSEVRLLENIRGFDRKTALEAVIDQRLMFREAARLPHTAPTPEEEENAYRSLRDRAPEAGSEDELRSLARRDAVILKYVAFRFRARIRISDEAVRASYEAEFAGREDAPDLSAVVEALRTRLEARELDEKIEAWVRELRDVAEIRYNP